MTRTARPEEIEHLADLWHQAWHDAHAGIVPPGLTALRTRADFRSRIQALAEAGTLLVAGDPPLGFVVTRQDELNQLMVAPEGRGTGTAAALLAAGAARIAAEGHTTAWLHCAVGNGRARRFYEREGWAVMAEEKADLATPGGRFAVPCWRMERDLRR